MAIKGSRVVERSSIVTKIDATHPYLQDEAVLEGIESQKPSLLSRLWKSLRTLSDLPKTIEDTSTSAQLSEAITQPPEGNQSSKFSTLLSRRTKSNLKSFTQLPNSSYYPDIPTIPEELIYPITGRRNSLNRTCLEWKTCFHDRCLTKRIQAKDAYEAGRNRESRCYGGRNGGMEKRMKIAVLRSLLKAQAMKDDMERGQIPTGRVCQNRNRLVAQHSEEAARATENENWWDQYTVDENDDEAKRAAGESSKKMLRGTLSDIAEVDETDL